MKKLSWIAKLTLAAVLAVSALSAPVPADAQQVQLCNRFDVLCPDVYSPVICSNGQVYGNGCYAYVACAEDCVPHGGDVAF
ncbi:MAG TPA: hypothetical protein VG477_08375 [Thermoanaerobaculia bacterium]|nr:hypothetical protein [Thermoanaerobaculia bacterium]